MPSGGPGLGTRVPHSWPSFFPSAGEDPQPQGGPGQLWSCRGCAPSPPVLCFHGLDAQSCSASLFQESAITPNDETLFPDVDWLIGNHSDELTPWIPVIAAR